MVGGNAKPDEAIGNRKPVNNVDADLVPESLLTGLRRVIARRSRSDHRHMPHEPLPLVSAMLTPTGRGAREMLTARLLAAIWLPCPTFMQSVIFTLSLTSTRASRHRPTGCFNGPGD